MDSPSPLPEEIVGLGKQELLIRWHDGKVTTYRARDLRLRCRCADCVEEWSGRSRIDSRKISLMLTAKHVEIAGNYGLRIHWSDGHHNGIYRLRDLYRG